MYRLQLKFRVFKILQNDYNVLLTINCYNWSFSLFTIVSLPDGYLFYKHLLRYDRTGTCPIISMLHLVRVSALPDCLVIQDLNQTHKFLIYIMCGNYIQRVKIVINNNIIEQVTDFKYLVYRIFEYKSDLEDKLRTYNKINEAIRRHFGKQMNKDTN